MSLELCGVKIVIRGLIFLFSCMLVVYGFVRCMIKENGVVGMMSVECEVSFYIELRCRCTMFFC